MHAVDKPKAQLQADPKEEKELQVNLIQALEMLRPNDSMIAELKEKLLAQKPESFLSLTAPQQRRLQEILNGEIQMRIQLILYYYMCCMIQISSHGLYLLMTQLFKWTTLVQKVSNILQIINLIIINMSLTHSAHYMYCVHM